MTRIHVPTPLSGLAQLDLPEDAANHVARVLRMRVGEALVLFDGSGREYAARIERVDRRSVGVSLLTEAAIDRESPLQLLLAQCVSRGERMDYTLQKAVELGVSAIQPLVSSRSVVRLDAERWDKKLEHWRGVVIAACEQSQRNTVPTLQAPLPLERWLASLASDQPPGLEAARYVLAPGGTRSLRQLAAPTAASLLVGPEGGLDEQELSAAQRAGFIPLGLGPRVLRTETAGVAALAAMQALWGDLG